ncbi:integration host factor subunit alpha [Methylocystis sp.]|jgi:integration host factor subunit alpha|uniref:integration host factor subunit alpha n=1 Tax=Methylocystis sp. TaxID=1911079 RepID=UPI003DA48BEC
MSIANPKEMLKPFVARANGDEVEHESASHEDGARGTLTREDIALAIHRRIEGMSRREAKRLTDLVIEEMAATLASGESLKLHDFGSFIVRTKRERAGRNPRTGAPVPIEARRVITFKASPNMKSAINGKVPLTKVKKRARGRVAPQNGGAEVARIFAP